MTVGSFEGPARKPVVEPLIFDERLHRFRVLHGQNGPRTEPIVLSSLLLIFPTTFHPNWRNLCFNGFGLAVPGQLPSVEPGGAAAERESGDIIRNLAAVQAHLHAIEDTSNHC